MSVFSSVCQEEHIDEFDVAYSIVGDEIRLWLPKEQRCCWSEVYMTIEKTEHLIELLQKALEHSK